MGWQAGYTWTVTFKTALGDIPEMVATDKLTGIGHNVVMNTTQQGNTIRGSFRVGFLGGRTRPIDVTASEEELEAILQVRARVFLSVSAGVSALTSAAPGPARDPPPSR
jgi:hypothetical protein